MRLISSLFAKLRSSGKPQNHERFIAMSDEDLNRIETALQVRLPETYRSVMLTLPAGRYDGYSLHEDASMIADRTNEQRSGYAGGQPWPQQYVYIGDEDDACPYALDCETGAVIYADHGNLAKPLARFDSVTEFVARLERGLKDED